MTPDIIAEEKEDALKLPVALEHGFMQDEEDQDSDIPYSVFTKNQNRCLVAIVAFASMFSPLSSFVYYPAIQSLARDLHSSVELINLTVTSYMIVSGVTPAIVGDLADFAGRRPVYLSVFVVYSAANLGLALQRSYPALLVLRMLQSAGGSGTISLAYGVVADIATPAERGSYVGVVLCGPNVAPSLGPVIGGILADLVGWPWIFWFLFILSGFCFILLSGFLLETSRAVVGNGGVPAKGVHRSLGSLFQKSPPSQFPCTETPQPRRLRCPNPLTCLFLLFRKDNALIVLINGIFYMIYCCIQASLSTLFIEIYGFKEIDAGLIYLPFGFGCLVFSFVSGKMMNRDFKITTKAHGIAVNTQKGSEAADFPIEKARFRSSWLLITIAIATITGYGWSLEYSTHVAIPLTLQFFIGASVTGIFNICGTLLTDVNHEKPATAQASSNIVRCALSASGLAVLQLMIDRLGAGWTFTIFAGVGLVTVPLIVAELYWGVVWRLARSKALQCNGDVKLPAAPA